MKSIFVYSLAFVFSVMGAGLYHAFVLKGDGEMCNVVTVDMKRLLSSEPVKAWMMKKKVAFESMDNQKRLLPAELNGFAKQYHWVVVDKACVISGSQDVTRKVVGHFKGEV